MFPLGFSAKGAYNANGNQKKRIVGGQTFALEYDAENRLVKACQDTSSNGICDTGETVIAQFTYDGDGRQVKAVMGSATTYYVGSHYEQTGTGTVTKYYFAGAQRVAMRIFDSTLSYLLGDHLGSTSLTTNTSGTLVAELRYKPWGETRYTSGTTPTNYQYTGQRNEVSIGLYFYNARWYDPSLGRFAQADSIIPPQQGVQAWDRFAYTNNNPVRYTDPTGHWIWFAVGAAILATPFVLSSFGIGPDMIGIDVARAVTRGSGDAVVTAGLAVQSQYPWAIVLGGGSGWAGATEDELKGENPYSPSVAVKVIEKRIDTALTACGTKCKTATDRLIVAALAQNGTGFDAEDVAELPMSNGTINWDYVMTELGDNPSDGFAKLRQDITNMNFETRFMLKIFMQDLRVLLGHGYVLPDEFEGADLDFIDTLITPQAPAQNRLPSPI